MIESLWGEEFNITEPKREIKKTINKTKAIKKDTEEPVEKKIKSKSLTFEEKLEIIRNDVYRILGKYKDNTIVIDTPDKLIEYIDASIKNDVIAIDTETNNSLDPITCKLAGPCIYTPGQKNAYIPINHRDHKTKERLSWQLTEEFVREQFNRLANTKIIMHNGKFDYQVIKCTCDCELEVFWDTMLAARIIDENEKSAGLKQQYISKIDSSIEKYSIEHLFKDVEYLDVPPDLFALYAATDAFMTYELYMYQFKQLSAPGSEKLLKLFREVEMPVLKVAAEMELTGICIDQEYAQRLSLKYHKMLDEVTEEIDKQLETYKDVIDAWRRTPDANYHPKSKKASKDGTFKEQKSKNEQLKDPPELTSPTQFAILLYDVLNVGIVDKKNPRGTGEDILKKIDNPLCALVLKQRGIDKLLGTYIDKLPACVNEKTGRLHAHFNQLGTETGRFSSSDPNLQNIPSHQKSIRMMFKATDGYAMVGSDFSL